MLDRDDVFHVQGYQRRIRLLTLAILATVVGSKTHCRTLCCVHELRTALRQPKAGLRLQYGKEVVGFNVGFIFGALGIR